MFGICLVRRLRVRVQEALVALRDHVAPLAAPVLEARQALRVGALPRSGARVVVYVVHAPASVAPHFPARRQRLRPLPRRRPRIMVYVVPGGWNVYFNLWQRIFTAWLCYPGCFGWLSAMSTKIPRECTTETTVYRCAKFIEICSDVKRLPKLLSRRDNNTTQNMTLVCRMSCWSNRSNCNELSLCGCDLYLHKTERPDYL